MTRAILAHSWEVTDMSTCKHCSREIYADDNGRGVTIWCHDFDSTVCYDDPPGTLEDHGRLTTAEPVAAYIREVAND
jgi:hypothetical protein